MGEQTIEAIVQVMTRVLIWFAVLIPLTIGSYFVPTKRVGCLVWLLRIGLTGATAVLGLTLLLFFIGPF